jgi:hypothetical protein
MNTALRNRYKFDDYDNLIMVILFCLMSFFLYRFFDHKYESPFDSHREKIAQLLNSKNIIKRKLNGQTSWFDVKGGQELYTNDYIYSYEDSEAQIQFENNDQIQISPNTLFQIKKKNNQIEMGLTSGSFIANFSNESEQKQLTVNVQGKNVVLRPVGDTKLIIGVGEKGAEITVTKGALQVDGRELKSSQKVTISENQKEWVMQNLNLKTEAPLDGAKYYFDKSQDILFRLALSRNGQYQLIVSRDVSFNNVLVKKEFNSPVVSWSFEEGGTYYWKVQEFDSENKILAESLPHNFRAIKKSAPIWENADEETFQVLEMENKNIPLEWNEIDSSAYDVEVKHDGHLQLITVNKNIFEFLPKAGGKYSIRVRAKYDDHFSDWSEVKNIQVTYLQTPPTPVFIDYPTPDALYYLHPNYPVQIRFTWNMLMGLNYHFQLKVNDVIKFDDELKQNSFEFPLEKSAILKWRIRSVHSQGVYSPWTNWMESNITIQNQKANWLPEEGSEVVLTRPQQLTQFHWSANSEEVEFELSKDENFQKIVHQKKLFESQIEIPIAEVGTYYWRTRYTNTSGKTMYSPPIKVKFRPTPPPDKPEIDSEILIKIKKKTKRTSFIKYIIDLFLPASYAEDGESVEIKLPKNTQAKFYHVEIYKDESEEQLLYTTKSKSEIINWRKGNAGTFYLRYSIIDHWDQEGPFSDFSKLKIELEVDKKSEDKKNEEKKQASLTPKENSLAPVVLYKRKETEIALGFAPTMFSFEETHATHTANYDGIAWQSLQISGHKSFNEIETDANIHYSKGKVFTTQDFVYLQGSFSLLYNLENTKSIKPEAGLSLEKYNFYAYQSSTSVVAENKSFTGVFIGAMFSFQMPITVHANYTIGDSAGLSASVQYHYRNWLPEFSYRQRSYSKSSDEVSFTAIGAGVSYVYSWD